MKSARHAAITQIIESRNIETQEELAAALQERGIRVTQATVSRDIKELHLIKVLSETGGYKYATLDKAEKGMNERFIRMFSESVLSAVCANNLVVRTWPPRLSTRCAGPRSWAVSRATTPSWSFAGATTMHCRWRSASAT